MIDFPHFLATLPGILFMVGYSAPVLFGVFCAWWAQQTNRNPWLWFFFGALLSPLAGLALLAFNRETPSEPAGEDLGSLLAVRKDVV
jgi:hypothetical protein